MDKRWITMSVCILLIVVSLIVSSRIDLTGRDNLYTYAEAWFHHHPGLTMNFATADEYYNLTFNDTTALNGFTWDGMGNLTCNVAGLYSVDFMACGSGQNNHVYHLGVGINWVVQENVVAHKKMAAGGDITVMAGTGFLRLSSGDVVSLMIRDFGGTGTGLYVHSNLNLIRIGD